jgi:hypothetical protein
LAIVVAHTVLVAFPVGSAGQHGPNELCSAAHPTDVNRTRFRRCKPFIENGRSRIRTWDLFLIREAL